MGTSPGTIDQMDYSNVYNTPIPESRAQDFANWLVKQKAKTGRDPLNDRYDYDVNGFFLSGQGTDDRGHATDKFKKPNHPTFSDESIYHGKDGHIGGSWINQGDKSYFKPSPTNLQFRTPDQLHSYLSAEEPGVQLMMPQVPLPVGLR